MTDKGFEETSELLLKINEVVAKMDAAIRVAAFEILVARFLGKMSAPPRPGNSNSQDSGNDTGSPDTSSLGEFLSGFETQKPLDALYVLIAWLYSQQGTLAFSVKQLKELANDSGLTIPARPDMTMKGAKNAGKSLFAQSGKNWKLTVSGELYIKETYKVSKGSASLNEG